MAKRGIDVSSHNGNINWGAVKNDGIDFAILRVGYGMYLNQKDTQFENYYAGATSVGIPVGVYLYSYAKNVSEAEREADCVINWLGDRKLNLPVYFDIEDPSQENLGRGTLDAMCRAFCNKIEQAGYPAGIYASKYWSTSVISGAEIFINADELLDYNAEYERLLKEKTKLEGEVARAAKKLSNEGFVSKAPENVIQTERDKQAKYTEMLAKVTERLAVVEEKIK